MTNRPIRVCHCPSWIITISLAATSQAAFFAKHNELLKAQNTLVASRESGERMMDLQRQLDTVDRNIEQDDRSLQAARDRVATSIEPVAPTPDDVRDLGQVRQWPMYALGSGGLIALVFLGWIGATLMSALRQDPYHPYLRTDETAEAAEAETAAVI